MSTVQDAVQRVAADWRQAMTIYYACGAETGCTSMNQHGGGPGRGPWQVEAGAGGSHSGAISEAAASDPLQSLTYYSQAGGLSPCVNKQDWRNPLAAAHAAALCWERPAKDYSASQQAQAAGFARQVTPGATQYGGGTSLYDNPLSGVPVIGGVLDGAGAMFTQVQTVQQTLANPETYLRAGMVIIGIGAMFLGAFAVAKDAG